MSEKIETSPAFEALRTRLAGDLEPVQPFAAGRWMALFVGLFAPLSAVALRSVYWRSDETAGSWIWASALELVVAVGLSIYVLREAVPARRPSLAALVGGAAAAAVLHGLLVLLTFAGHPVYPPPGAEWAIGLFCYRWEVALGVPAVLFGLWLARSGLAARPLRVGALGGAGAGLAADAVWRLVCPFSAPSHAFFFHTPGVVTVVAIGLALAAWWEGARARSWRTQRPDLGG